MFRLVFRIDFMHLVIYHPIFTATTRNYVQILSALYVRGAAEGAPELDHSSLMTTDQRDEEGLQFATSL